MVMVALKWRSTGLGLRQLVALLGLDRGLIVTTSI